jgi:hypothetical protein
MANELQPFLRLTLAKTGLAIASGDISVNLDTAEPDGGSYTQDLTADTIETLDIGDVAAPAGMILVKLITPASGTNVEISLKNSSDFDTYRFGVLTKQNHAMLWSPKLADPIYIKAIGAGARVLIVVG